MNKLLVFIRKHLKRGFKYACVGTSGFLIDAGFLYYFTQYIHIWYVLSELFATLITFATNYFFNTYWTYRDAMKNLENDNARGSNLSRTVFSRLNAGGTSKTTVSKKGQVAIPKQARDKLSLNPGTVLKVQVEGKRVILEPLREPPKEAFMRAGSTLTESLLHEAKTTSGKAQRLLRDLGVPIN